MNRSFTNLENRLFDSRAGRFWQELFRNSGQFPIALFLLEFLKEKWDYFSRPDFYILLPSTLLQSYYLSQPGAFSMTRRFFGNLIAPFLYALVEFLFEGGEFFRAPQHIAYLLVSIAIALFQSAQIGRSGFIAQFFLVMENLVRAEILFVLYVVFETFANPNQTVSVSEFFNDSSHQFIGLAVSLLGLSLAFAAANSQRYLALLTQTAAQLRIYSEWLLGRDLLGRALNDPNSMTLSRQTRSILFMDIRGFTAWCETHTPEEVTSMLDGYYALIENILQKFNVIKYKFTADELMAVFIDANEAARAMRTLREDVRISLSPLGLGAGIGAHTGLVMEGLFGAQNVRFYDVIGDTVNTASRIEKTSNRGEAWISEDMLALIESPVINGEKEIEVKGKQLPLKVYSIQ